MAFDANDPYRVFALSQRGFYVMKASGDQYYFGRSKAGVLYWEKSALSDLLNLGVGADDVERMVVDVSYFACTTGIKLHAW